MDGALDDDGDAFLRWNFSSVVCDVKGHEEGSARFMA